MSLLLYIQCFFAAQLGQALQVALKIRSMKIKADAASLPFNWKQALKDDAWSIVLTEIAVLSILFFIDEVVQIKPAVMSYIKFGFTFVGYTGSDIVVRFFGVANKKLNTALGTKDEKHESN
jgi:hypothetical protein